MAELTHLEARYVVRSKLDSLLRQLFGDSNYSVHSQSDTIEVSAPRKLSKGEIDSVTATQ
ncbi:hypothetical protein M426DRAFT_318109 [Hypoxylon sp. CI-4A]|nr:hypothetical protein M426DRAFT_318109 [Hypoxylon sp. CI-4A]